MVSCTDALKVETFLNDVSTHEIEVIRDESFFKHIRFKKPDCTSMYFDLVTWNGHLCYTGDMGTYVFSRISDMFHFFRCETDDLRINPGYWAEKVLSESRNGAIEEFNHDIANRIFLGDVVSFFKANRDETTQETRQNLWEDVVYEIINKHNDDPSGALKIAAAYAYDMKVGSQGMFMFQDIFDHNFNSFTYRYLWACYAIVWGIKKYDDHKSSQQSTQSG